MSSSIKRPISSNIWLEAIKSIFPRFQIVRFFLGESLYSRSKKLEWKRFIPYNKWRRVILVLSRSWIFSFEDTLGSLVHCRVNIAFVNEWVKIGSSRCRSKLTWAETSFIIRFGRDIFRFVLSWSQRDFFIHNKPFCFIFAPNRASWIDMDSFIGVIASWPKLLNFRNLLFLLTVR